MKKILHLLIGITSFSVDEKNEKRVINSANKNNILLLDATKEQNIAYFTIYSKDESCFFSILSSEEIEFKIIRKTGLKRIFKKY